MSPKSSPTPIDDKIIKDWRGIEIKPGQTVIFASHIGKIAFCQVEGIVEGFTPSNRIFVNVTRRAYTGYYGGERIHLDPTKLTVVNVLPETKEPTMQDLKDIHALEMKTREDHFNTHDMRERPVRDYGQYSVQRYDDYQQKLREWEEKPCRRCRLTNRELHDFDCPLV